MTLFNAAPAKFVGILIIHNMAEIFLNLMYSLIYQMS